MSICNLKNKNDQKKCLEGVEKIQNFVNQNGTMLIKNISNNINKTINIDALLKLIDSAMSDIRIYTDSIKDEVHGDDLFIEKISDWIIHYPHHRLKILLKNEQKGLINTKLYQTLYKLDEEYKQQIEIRFLDGSTDTKFNCFVADRSSYKLKLIDNDKAYLSFNDTYGVAKTMNVVFNKYFKKANKVAGFGFSFNINEMIMQFFNNKDDKAFADNFYEYSTSNTPKLFADIDINNMVPKEKLEVI